MSSGAWWERPRRHTLSIGEALARSGVKGGTVPPMVGGLTPTILVADYSKSFSGEPLEARAVASTAGFAVAVGNRFYALLTALSPGGAIVEAFSFLQTNGNNLSWIDRVTAPLVPISVSPLQPVESGGEAVRSVAVVGETAQVPSGAVADWSNSFVSGIAILGPHRFYVPPGATLQIISDHTGGGFGSLGYTTLMWREIPEQIGLP